MSSNSVKEPGSVWQDFAKTQSIVERAVRHPYTTFLNVVEGRLVNVILRQLSGDSYILDVGCGTGRWTVNIAKHGVNVVGVDVAPDFIKMAKVWAVKKGIRGYTDFVVADVKSLPFNCDSLHGALCIVVLQHLQSVITIAHALQEMKRVLRNRALIVMRELAPKQKNEYIISPWSPPALAFSVGEWKKMFSNVNFRVNEVRGFEVAPLMLMFARISRVLSASLLSNYKLNPSHKTFPIFKILYMLFRNMAAIISLPFELLLQCRLVGISEFKLFLLEVTKDDHTITNKGRDE